FVAAHEQREAAVDAEARGADLRTDREARARDARVERRVAVCADPVQILVDVNDTRLDAADEADGARRVAERRGGGDADGEEPVVVEVRAEVGVTEQWIRDDSERSWCRTDVTAHCEV